MSWKHQKINLILLENINTEVVEYKVDKKAILKDLKLGKEIEGAKLVSGGTSLLIK